MVFLYWSFFCGLVIGQVGARFEVFENFQGAYEQDLHFGWRFLLWGSTEDYFGEESEATANPQTG